jgi:ubiquinone/menaquinone biosynthesis C-methylase UbiE
MGFFNWSAPFFHHVLDRRWRARDIDTLADLLRPYVPVGGALLDLGGGTGGLSVRMITALDAQVTILDPTPEMISRAPTHPSLHTVLGAAESIPFADDAFDAVLVSDAFHHFRDLEGAVKEMVRVVRPRGGVVVLEIDPGGWRRAIVAAERLVGEPAHVFRQDEFCRFMAAQGVPGRCLPHDSLSYLYVGEVNVRRSAEDPSP